MQQGRRRRSPRGQTPARVAALLCLAIAGGCTHSEEAGPDQASRAIVHAAAGDDHTLLIAADGSSWACGAGGDGQLGVNPEVEHLVPSPILGLPPTTMAAAGGAHSVFLARSGIAWMSGYAADGRLGIAGERYFGPIESLVGGLSAVAAGTDHNVGLTTGGEAITWGADDRGQLGDGSPGAPSEPGAVAAPGLRDVTAVAARGRYSMALVADGSVWTWGDNTWGTLGTPGVDHALGTGTSVTAPDSPRTMVADPVRAEVADVVSIAAGYAHVVAALANGRVVGWGRNLFGSIGQEEDDHVFAGAVPIAGPTGITVVAAGLDFSLALDGAGRVWSWGYGEQGQLGRGLVLAGAPAVISNLPPIAAIAAGARHAVAVDTTGRAWSWGASDYGQGCSAESQATTFAPVPIALD